MKPLTYHPLYDPYHCMFRMLSLLAYKNDGEIEEDRLRILDFYVTNPFFIKKIKLTMELRKRLNDANIDKWPMPYQELPSPRALYMRMEGVQKISLRHLAGAGLISREGLIAGQVISASFSRLSDDFSNMVKLFMAQHHAVLSFLCVDLKDIPLRGEDGLKHRTDLMEYRYDAL